MLAPVVIEEISFQSAWIQAVEFLKQHQWNHHNLVVHVLDTQAFDKHIHDIVASFASNNNLRSPEHVASTIFPWKQYVSSVSAIELYSRYARIYERSKKARRGTWGTYFNRMIGYQASDQRVNQLQNIIDAIRLRDQVHGSAYTIIIQHPGSETIRPLGGPCLNYLAVQIVDRTQIGILGVYRNHEFLERAYGNYWGLCRLIRFLAQETGLSPGPLTCVSSHAYVKDQKRNLISLLEELG